MKCPVQPCRAKPSLGRPFSLKGRALPPPVRWIRRQSMQSNNCAPERRALRSSGLHQRKPGRLTRQSATVSSKPSSDTRWKLPPWFSLLLRRAISIRIRRMASAAAQKKWPRAVPVLRLLVSTRRKYASWTSASLRVSALAARRSAAVPPTCVAHRRPTAAVAPRREDCLARRRTECE